MFGESEKGHFHRAYLFETLPQLIDKLGHPPRDSRGIFYAVQTILYENRLIYFRVREEGFSESDYLQGLEILRTNPLGEKLAAIFAPGVGSKSLIEVISEACRLHESILLTTEADLYDYLVDSF